LIGERTWRPKGSKSFNLDGGKERPEECAKRGWGKALTRGGVSTTSRILTKRFSRRGGRKGWDHRRSGAVYLIYEPVKERQKAGDGRKEKGHDEQGSEVTRRAFASERGEAGLKKELTGFRGRREIPPRGGGRKNGRRGEGEKKTDKGSSSSLQSELCPARDAALKKNASETWAGGSIFRRNLRGHHDQSCR